MSVTPGSYEPKTYNCNESQTEFDFDWRIFEEEDLVVTVWDSNGNPTILSYSAGDFTVAKAGNDWKSGGTITTAETYASGNKLTIERSVSRKQPADYIENDNFPAEIHEAVLDRAVMIIQELEVLLDRAILMPAADSSTLDMEVPTKDNRKLRYFYWDENGEPAAATMQSLDGVTVTSYMETLLDDVDAQQAQETLELIEEGEQVSDFIKTLLNDADAATALTTLGLSEFIQTLVNDADAATARTTLGAMKYLRDTGMGMGYGTRDSSGNTVITELGFQPSLILFLAADYTSSNCNWSMGFDDGTNHYCLKMDTNHTRILNATNHSLAIFRDGSNHIDGQVSAIGADGFTITWALMGTCKASYNYLALP